MSGEQSIEIEGATVVALVGCEEWPCSGCKRGLRVGDRAYIGLAGVVHALPAPQGGCDPSEWPDAPEPT